MAFEFERVYGGAYSFARGYWIFQEALFACRDDNGGTHQLRRNCQGDMYRISQKFRAKRFPSPLQTSRRRLNKRSTTHPLTLKKTSGWHISCQQALSSDNTRLPSTGSPFTGGSASLRHVKQNSTSIPAPTASPPTVEENLQTMLAENSLQGTVLKSVGCSLESFKCSWSERQRFHSLNNTPEIN